MLSRVAERLYWTARYLERVENTVRLVDVYDKLMFDLPSSVNLGWYNLVAINSAESLFAERYTVHNERNVVKFLLRDESNPSSVVSSLKMVRENLRTTRDVVPGDTWEMINELSMFVENNIQQGVNRSQRFEFLDGVIKGCQQIHGLIYGTMAHDAVWYFMRLGRNLERADMTTRLLDAGSSALVHTAEDEAAVNSRQIIWGNVLRSLGGDQSYRRATRSAVSGSEVVRYLLENPAFPRTIAHCFNAIKDSASHLPRSSAVTQHINTLKSNAFDEVDYRDLGQPLKDYLNDLQLDLASVHVAIRDNWFANH